MKWKFKKDADVQGNSDGFWYGINEGYINPEEVLKDPAQLKKLNNALDTLLSFEGALEEAGLLNEF